ncbi:MAG: hypothetical protein IPO21_04490 [Bacteroidales bacterium]|nr:hypothetical protein [Bacteroidales bacterium]
MKTKLVIFISLLIICGNSALCNSESVEINTYVLHSNIATAGSSIELSTDSYAKKKKMGSDSDLKKHRNKKLKRRANRRSYGSATQKYTRRYNPFDID